tara:strand:- start:87 stop:359 length:273 start_codon:yes stop_codon:yes gene_type:complete
MKDQSMEDFLFTHKVYKEAQINFLKKGLQGSAEKMLDQVADSFNYTKDNPDIKEFFMNKIAQNLLVDLKEGLMNNDLENVDLTKLTNEKT